MNTYITRMITLFVFGLVVLLILSIIAGTVRAQTWDRHHQPRGYALPHYGAPSFQDRLDDLRWDLRRDMERVERQRQSNDLTRDIIRGWDEEERERRRQSYTPFGR
jgi:hypothetical protein